jgi:hypothetical protein
MIPHTLMLEPGLRVYMIYNEPQKLHRGGHRGHSKVWVKPDTTPDPVSQSLVTPHSML